MPLYEYVCHKCEVIEEVYHRIDDETKWTCEGCGGDLDRLISAVFSKKSDPDFVSDINGIVNDLEMVNSGKEERIETREQAVRKIQELYADPYRTPKDDHEVAANKRVGELRTRYTERFK